MMHWTGSCPACRVRDREEEPIVTKILVVDDHAVVRHGVKQILSEQFHDAVIGEAPNAEELFRQVRKERWDIVVLDVGMPGKGGLDALKDLKLLHPKLPVLVLSAYPEDQLALRMLKAGATGYLSKDSAPNELVQAIRKILGSGKFVSAAVAETPGLEPGNGIGQTAPRAVVGPRVPGAVPDRRRKKLEGDRGRSVRQRQHRQYLSGAHPRKDATEEQHRAHPLRHRESPGEPPRHISVLRPVVAFRRLPCSCQLPRNKPVASSSTATIDKTSTQQLCRCR